MSSTARHSARRHVLDMTLAALAALVHTGCADTTYGADIVPYNHTSSDIAAVYVNGTWGGNSFAHSGGGKFVCCAELPKRSPKDFSVTIGWDDESFKHHERLVKVEPYSQPGHLAVHFLRGDKIKVFVVSVYLNHPDYPLKGEEATLRPGVPNPQPNFGK
jgi:hypothetical protein